MNYWKTLAAVFCLVLVGTNLVWVHASIDDMSAEKYQQQELYERTEMLKALVALTPKLAAGKLKSEVIGLAEQVAGEESFEKEGAFWAGWIGLRFDDKGELVEILPVWSYGPDVPTL